jgi:hypothetical protein
VGDFGGKNSAFKFTHRIENFNFLCVGKPACPLEAYNEEAWRRNSKNTSSFEFGTQ